MERSVIASENIAQEDFQIVGLRAASSKGTRRELLAPCKDLTIAIGEREAIFKFTLNKGCYATTLLREFMKAEIMQY
jgi:tRNA pseudouridine13 synthase